MRKCKVGLIATALAIFVFTGLAQVLLETWAEARAGGGRSGGFRGSRTYQAPSRPSQPSPSQASREATPPPQQPGLAGSQPGGFMRGIAGGLLGGFLGSMLFSGLAHAGWGGFGGSGFGMIEMLLIAGLIYFIYRKFRTPALATSYSPMQYQNTGVYTPSSAPVQNEPAVNQPDFKSILMMDQSFDPSRFLKSAQDLFFKVQGAWNRQDVAALRSFCGTELIQVWEQELGNLRALRRRNRMDNIALRSSEITEAWTEAGQDYVTIRVLANLLDYTVDEKGTVVEGSDSEAIEFEEFWTFSRPVGPNAWKLTAVQQA